MLGVPTIKDGDALVDDQERPEAPIGRTGGKARGTWGSAYEHNRRLANHPERIAAMRQCLTYGPCVTGLDAWLGVMHQPTWSVEPADESPEALAYADHIALCLGIGRVSPIGCVWPAKLEELLTACLYGFGVWETIPREVDGVFYTDLQYRDPGSIAQFVVDESDRLVAVEQIPLSGVGVGQPIPMSQALHLVWRPVSSDDYTGVGMLRAVEPIYRENVMIQQLAAVAAQKWAVGMPTATLDPELCSRYGIDTPEQMQQELIKARRDLKKLTSHEQGHLMYLPWIKIGTFGGDITQLSTIDAMIDSRDRRILTVWLQQWLMLGSANAGGSYSLGETHVKAARDHAAGVLTWAARSIDRFIERAIRWQFGLAPAVKLPRLRFDGLSSEVFVDKLAMLPSLVTAGLVDADDTSKDAIRRALELPAIPK